MLFIDEMSRIDLGITGEQNNVIRIDVSDWLAKEPDGVFEIMAIRPGEEQAYIAVTALVDGVLEWTVTAGDVGISGRYGKADIRMYAGGRIKKSRVMPTYVDATLPGTTQETPPEAMQGWADQVAGYKREAAASAAAAAESAAAAEREAEAAAAAETEAEHHAWMAGGYASAAASSATIADEKAAEALASEDMAGKLAREARAYM